MQQASKRGKHASACVLARFLLGFKVLGFVPILIMWEMCPTKQQGATMAKQAAWRENIEVVAAYIVEKFGGNVVHNAALKEALVQGLPELFPGGRADAAIEFLASVDFASCYTKAGPRGIALLEGIKDGGKRFWRVPTTTAADAKHMADVDAMQAPLPTKARRCIRFGEYVAKGKVADEG